MIPLSYSERRLWYLNQLGGGAEYHITFAVRLRGALDMPALRAALVDLVARHEPLRTIFPSRNGEPFRKPLDPGAVPTEPAIVACTEAALDGAIAAAKRQPIDITSEPPLRPWLFVLGPAEYVLLIVLHRIAGTGWTMGPFLRDLGRAFEVRSAGGGRVAGWHDTQDVGLRELFERQVARTPGATALVFGGTEISYAELNARANQIARYLVKHGVRPGDLVGIQLERSPTLIAAMLAVLKAGAGYVMVDSRFAAESGVTTVITMSSRSSGLGPANIDFVYLDVECSLIAQEPDDDLPPPARAGPRAGTVMGRGSYPDRARRRSVARR